MQLTRPLLSGSFGMAGSTHWLATACAMSVLERGGNAFDAAAAGGFVLQVVEPHLNGPGGEVPIVVWSERDQQVRVVCGQGVAPAGATIEAYEALGVDAIPGTGLLAATVPGAFGGWLLMLEQWGTWSLRDVLSYAISYARNGYPALPAICGMIGSVVGMFRDDWPTSAAAWLPGGGVPVVGSRLTSPRLADTYERVVVEAERASSDRDGQLEAARVIWYEGFVAEEFGRFSTNTQWKDSTGDVHGGFLTAADLAAWRPTVEAAATYDYGRYTICKTQAWGQGPVFLAQLALLTGFDLDAMGHLSADYLHTVVECSKLAFADREAWYGDAPGVADLPDLLLDKDYNDERRRLVTDTASNELRPGVLAGRQPRLSRQAGPTGRGPTDGAGPHLGHGAGEPTVQATGETRGDTCHIDVVDAAGNLVSATPSGGWLQSSPYIPELGFCLGSRAQMFWLDRGLPSSLAPGTRPRTTLSPSLALRDGEPWMAFGTPGGDQQDQWSLAFFLAVVHGKLDLQAAIEAPSYHSDHFPSSFAPRHALPGRLAVEDRLGEATIAELRRRGHDVKEAGPWSLGRMSAVAREGQLRLGAANPRGGQGYAAGR
jgi:gamma-glutamyltranspeptidase / glutathione hydrolase